MHTHVAAAAFMQEGMDPTWPDNVVIRILAHVRRYKIATPEELKGWVGYEVKRNHLAYVVTYARNAWLQALAAQTILLFDDTTVHELESIVMYMDEPQPFSWRRIPWRARQAIRYIIWHLELNLIDFSDIRNRAWKRLLVHPDLAVRNLKNVARIAPEPWSSEAKQVLADMDA